MYQPLLSAAPIIVQSTTGKHFYLIESKADEWAGQWPTERTGDILVTEYPCNILGSMFVYWLGDKGLDSPDTLDAIQRHLDDHDVQSTRVILVTDEQMA